MRKLEEEEAELKRLEEEEEVGNWWSDWLSGSSNFVNFISSV